MNGLTTWIDTLFGGDYAAPAGGPRTFILVLLLAFIVGHIVAWVYMWTHAGLSYSQMFTSSLLVMPVLVSVFMLLVTSNAFVALGMLAVFTMIRFRNVLKDTRDTTYILWSIVEGMAVGTMHFGLALVGAVAIGFIFIYLRFTSFGGRHRYDVIVSMEWMGDVASAEGLRSILHRHGARVQLASQRELEGERLDVSYRLLLRDPARSRELLSELKGTPGVDRPVIYHREDESEL